MRAFGRALAAWTGCALLTAILLAAYRHVGAPTVASWSSAERWYEQVGPSTALISVFTPVALAVAAWLLLAATVQLFATVVRGPVATATAARLSPRAMQRFVQGVAGASFAVGVAVVAPSAGLAPGGGEPGTATLELIEPGVPVSEHESRPAPFPPAPSSPPPSPPPAVRSTTVAPGDSFWSIAESAMQDDPQREGTEPSTAEIARYWLRLVNANRTILVDPSNPDLIFRGQVVDLPAVSPASRPGSPPSPAP